MHNKALHNSLAIDSSRHSIVPQEDMDTYWLLGGGHGLILRTALRTGQFLFTIIAAGLYGADLAGSSRLGQRASSTWVFAEVLVAFTAVTCAVHCFLTITHLLWCGLDAVLAVMWLAVTVLTGQMAYDTSGDSTPDSAVNVTHATALLWIDVIILLLCFTILLEACLFCCTARTLRRRQRQSEVEAQRL